MIDLTVTSSKRRPDVQALRALAVIAVVLHHSWPGLAPGGYLGVDIFFVVSGYLITRHLVGEFRRDGRVRLGRFYARRARRLLPAATLVLTTLAIVTLLVVPSAQWTAFFSQIGASALYVQNWLLLAPVVGPDPATVVRHFWSLSVEEQFYLVWPLLVIAGGAVAARRSADPRRVLLVGGLAITVLSFAGWVVVSAVDYQAAYFNTATRAWEFAVGGVLALLPGLVLRGRVAAVVFWACLGVLVASITTFGENPGAWSALPVLATIGVLVSCADAVPVTARGLVEFRPVQWMGDISYALYLWHWPVLLLAPYVTGVPSPTWFMVLLLTGTVLLSWVTTVFVEDPVRRTPLEGAQSSPRRRIAVLAVGTGLAIAVGVSTVASAVERPAEDDARLQRGVATIPDCVAPGRTPDL